MSPFRYFLLGICAAQLVGGILLLRESSFASGTENTHTPVAFQFNHNHAAWDTFLKKHVYESGQTTEVDYAAIKRNRRELDAYLDSLQTVAFSEFLGLSSNERLAFLINAYNAFTIKLIVDNYPVKSIKDLGSILSSPWKKKFFKLFMEDRSLDEIEHEMIRKKFSEPRIHFAVNCASKGCPSLKQEAFTAENLERQLEEAANSFLKDQTRNRFDSKEKVLYLSSIFKWYGGDFEKKSGSVKAYVASRIAKTPDEAKQIRSDEVKIKYLDYDWNLNERKAIAP